MCFQQQMCLILLVGIPGSGKTFFRECLGKYFQTCNNSILGCVKLHNVCYDDYEYVKNPVKFADTPIWKIERSKILSDVKDLIVNFKRIIDSKSPLPAKCPDKPEKILVVIDDNMFYRSMRYEYFKLAKTYNLGFAQLYFKISLEEALKCNEKRESNHLPDSVISTMFNKLEPPDNCNKWEKYSITIHSYANFEDISNFDIILECFNIALENPFCLDPEQNKLAKLSSQIVTSSNTIHQIDNILKQLVGFCIKKKMAEVSSCDRKTVASSVNNKRIDILTKIKQGVIRVPVDLTQPFDQDTNSVIRPYLLNLLDC